VDAHSASLRGLYPAAA